MDFAKPLIKIPNTVTRANIHYISLSPTITPTITTTTTTTESIPGDRLTSTENPSPNNGIDIDRLVVEASNRAASDLILSNTSSFQVSKKFKPNSDNKIDKLHLRQAENHPEELEKRRNQWVHSDLYPTYLLQHNTQQNNGEDSHSQEKILPHSLVVIFESFDSLRFLYVTPGATYSNRNGVFRHDDFLYKPYGSKVRSYTHRGYGFVYLLKPSPELWTRTLHHRTQIISESDASFIISQLDIRPNRIVCESGTGSGAMSHFILRSIAPWGHLHTYEFHKVRVETARLDFQNNGVSHLVTVHWRDVCGEYKEGQKEEEEEEEETNHEKDKSTLSETDNTGIPCGGFNLGPSSAHAIVLDLPEPWKAIPHAAYTLQPNGRLCSYSPCVEQCHRTIEILKKFKFHSIQTMEVRLRENYVDEVELENVPKDIYRCELNPNPWIPPPANDPTSLSSSSMMEISSSLSFSLTTAKTETKTNPQQNESCIEKSPETTGRSSTTSRSSSSTKEDTNSNTKWNKILCARPFPSIKGHTAFLTFATASNKTFPDPNNQGKGKKKKLDS